MNIFITETVPMREISRPSTTKCNLSTVLFVSGMELSGFPETLYLIQTINAIP